MAHMPLVNVTQADCRQIGNFILPRLRLSLLHTFRHEISLGRKSSFLIYGVDKSGVACAATFAAKQAINFR
jgi:hypothetical protein